jgi:BolA protein
MNSLTEHDRMVAISGMSVEATIRGRLAKAFSPVALDVVDESALHAGHAGARPGGETHFRVRIVSADFHGLSRVDRQRAVYKALAEELQSQVHALALTTLTPDEAR